MGKDERGKSLSPEEKPGPEGGENSAVLKPKKPEPWKLEIAVYDINFGEDKTGKQSQPEEFEDTSHRPDEEDAESAK